MYEKAKKETTSYAINCVNLQSGKDVYPIMLGLARYKKAEQTFHILQQELVYPASKIIGKVLNKNYETI